MADRRQFTVAGFALLGAGALMLLHNSSAAAKPPPKPAPPPPAPLPPAPVASRPPPVPTPVVNVPTAAVAAVIAQKLYVVKNINGTIRFGPTPDVAGAISAAKATGSVGITVWQLGGGLIYQTVGAIASRTVAAAPKPAPPPPYVPPVVSAYAGQATLSKSGRSL